MSLVIAPGLVMPRRVLRESVRVWALGNIFLLRWIADIKLEVRGREYIPVGAGIVACKHQSEWEANSFFHLFRDSVYVMKRELGYIPLYGLFAHRMKMIVIDRGGRARTLREMVRKARERLAEGKTIVIFPEGTRIPPGTRVPYRPGVAALYAQLDVPVVPAVLNSGLHWPKQTFRKYPGTIVLRFLPPIPPGLDRRVFLARLENTMEAATAELMAESLGEEGAEAVRASAGG